jgi:hypothetical protein
MVLFCWPVDSSLRYVDDEDEVEEEVQRSYENDGGDTSRSATGVSKEVTSLRFNSCRSGEMVSRGYLSGDAVVGGVSIT